MPANSSINLTALDFDTLKANLITFMQSQSVFKDYNFLGSNLNVLMDILAYNSTLNCFYLNMVASEAFLDTAQLRDSVVSRAKELNYIPRSARSAMAAVSISFSTSGISGSFQIPAGTMFSGTNSNGAFSFITDQNHTLLSAGANYFIPGVAVFEGKLFTETFIVDNTIENQKFMLSNQNIDTTSIHVTVTNNSGSSIVNYRMATSLIGLTGSSMIFFVQEDRGSIYEIYFGDGIFGLMPPNGSMITITYRVTKGAQGNGVFKLTLAQDLGPANDGVVTSANVITTTPSQDGADLEGIESVRFRAPKHFQAQGRAVTSADYRDIILEQFPEVKDASVFGGEDISGSVQYGTVFLAMTTNSGAPVSGAMQTEILSFLADKKIFVKLAIKDPQYIYIVPRVTVYVDFSQTTLTPSDIRTEVIKSIIFYNTKNLQVFNSKFMGSKFFEAIDSADVAITGSDAKFIMYKNVLFANGFPQTITVNFNNSITPGTISSTDFILSDGNEYQISDFNPNLNTFMGSRADDGTFRTLNSSNTLYFNSVSNNQSYLEAGQVNYDKGSLYIQSIDVYSFMNPGGIRINTLPANNDIYGVLENVVEIDVSNVSVNVVAA